MNLIIINNIDPWQLKIEVSMHWVRFMIHITGGKPIHLASYIFARIQSDTNNITIDILPFGGLITQFLLTRGV